MSRTLIPASGEYVIKPSNIHINKGRVNPLYPSEFGHPQTEVAAARIVRFCQDRNEGWKPFTTQELHDWWCKNGRNCYSRGVEWHLYVFGRLIDKGYIIPQIDGTYAVTTEFVDICKRAVD
jgi:hypothetical protein